MHPVHPPPPGYGPELTVCHWVGEWEVSVHTMGSRRGSRIQKGGFVQEFRLENRSYPDVHDFSLRMQVIIAND